MNFHPRTWSPLTMGIVALLTVTALFGGASRLHELRLAMVELTALPLLVIALRRWLRDGGGPSMLATSLLGGAMALPLLQLVPLPPGVWTALPGRDQAALALQIADIPTPWASISLTPDRTWRSFLALLPPVAIFLGLVLYRARFQVRFVYGLLAFVLLSVGLGAAQVASGGDALYLWPTTSSGTVVGFFANRNHFATLCLSSLPFAAVLAGHSLQRGRERDHLVFWIASGFLAIAVVALGVIRSRMGIGLLVPTLFFSLFAAWIASGGGRPKPLFLGVVGAVGLGLAVLALNSLGPIIQRFDDTGVIEGRFENWPVVASAAETYLPTGSGIGSFDTVYRSVEPLDRLDATFFNQAHNDFLETWLEAGWMGAALIIAFLVWFLRRTWTAWSSGASVSRDLQRAASVAVGAILLHSLVDYPLRTETIAVLFAMCCGLLELAGRSNQELGDEEPSRRSRRSRVRV